MKEPIIAPFHERFIIKGFNCGNNEVNDFLKEKACDQERNRITKLFVAHINHQVIAYSATFCSHLFLKLPTQEKEFRD